MESNPYAGRAARVSHLVDLLELSDRVRSFDDTQTREAIALADGLIDIAEAVERFVNEDLPSLEGQTGAGGVEDALDTILAGLREVVWHMWYAKFLRMDLLGGSLNLPWINDRLRP
jgi:hypothetical protein